MCRDHSPATSRGQGTVALVSTAGDSLRAPHCWPQTHSLLPDRHGQYPSPALGYLMCSRLFMKVPSETQNRGYAGLSQGPAGGDLADSAVGLFPH